MSVRVIAIAQPALPPLVMPDRFRHDIAYFMSIPGEQGIPLLGPHEYWIDAAAAREWLEEGCFRIVSPLDSTTKTEVELSEEQENWLQWMVDNEVVHVRLE